MISHGVVLSEDEKEFLKLPKSATDYVPVDMESIKTSIQVKAAKLRMSMRQQEESNCAVDVGHTDSQGLADEREEAERASCRVFDVDEGRVDLSKKKVTDMSSCRRIKVPDAAEVSKEAKLQVLINNLEDVAVKAGRKEKSCPVDGGSTMTAEQKRGKERLE